RKNNQCDNASDEKQTDHRHNPVDVSPPSCVFVLALIIDTRKHRQFHIVLSSRLRHHIWLWTQRPERSNKPRTRYQESNDEERELRSEVFRFGGGRSFQMRITPLSFVGALSLGTVAGISSPSWVESDLGDAHLGVVFGEGAATDARCAGLFVFFTNV